jgi:hypothetical protein
MTGLARRLVEVGLAALCIGSVYQLAVALGLLDLGEGPAEWPASRHSSAGGIPDRWPSR